MQDDLDYDAQTLKYLRPEGAGRRPFYHRLLPARLRRKRRECPLRLIGYDPVGKLQRAASTGNMIAVECFITDFDFHVDESDWKRRTPLHYACAHNHPNVVALLLKNNSEINLQDDEGCTPLIKATQRDNVECVSILLKHGADPHLMDLSGETAFHHAVHRDNTTIAGLLLRHDVDIDVKTEYGLTALSLAEYEHQEQMMEFLRERGAKTSAEIKQKDSEASLQEQLNSVDKSTQISVEQLKSETDRSSECIDQEPLQSEFSGETTAKQPQLRTEKHVRFNDENERLLCEDRIYKVYYSTDPKPSYREARPPRELKSILKSSGQFTPVILKKATPASLCTIFSLKLLDLSIKRGAKKTAKKSISRVSQSLDAPGPSPQESDPRPVIKLVPNVGQEHTWEREKKEERRQSKKDRQRGTGESRRRVYKETTDNMGQKKEEKKKEDTGKVEERKRDFLPAPLSSFEDGATALKPIVYTETSFGTCAGNARDTAAGDEKGDLDEAHHDERPGTLPTAIPAMQTPDRRHSVHKATADHRTGDTMDKADVTLNTCLTEEDKSNAITDSQNYGPADGAGEAGDHIHDSDHIADTVQTTDHTSLHTSLRVRSAKSSPPLSASELAFIIIMSLVWSLTFLWLAMTLAIALLLRKNSFRGVPTKEEN